MNALNSLILVGLFIVVLYLLLRKRENKNFVEKAVVERKNGKVTVKCPYCGYTIGTAKRADGLFVHTSSKEVQIHYADGHYLCPKCKRPLDIPEEVLQELEASEFGASIIVIRE